MSRTQIVTKDIQDSLEVNCVIFAGLDKKARWTKLVDLLPPPGGDGLALTTIAVTINGVTYTAGTLIDNLLNIIDSVISGDVTKTAGETISSGMAIMIDTDGKVYKYNVRDMSHYGAGFGIAKTSGVNGSTIVVRLAGTSITDVGSGWTQGVSYFIAENSLLTSTAPSIGGSDLILKRIAIGTSTDTVFINDFEERILIP